MEKQLLARLESLRKEMIGIAERKGLSHPDVLRISQEVDQLHNKLNLIGKYSVRAKMKIMIREASMKRAYIYARACV
jgi:S-adenosylmethionine synthetase